MLSDDSLYTLLADTTDVANGTTFLAAVRPFRALASIEPADLPIV